MQRKGSLGAIFLTVVIDLLGFGLVLPFLADEARVGFGVTPFVGALLGAVYSLMQFLFVPVWGALSDRVGRKPVLLWSIAATAVGMAGLGVALAFGQSVVWLFVARIFSGIATANLGTASAYIADVTPPEERARGMGFIGMAFGIGFILGPAIGGILAKYPVGGRHGPVACFAAAALSVVNVVWVAFGVPESYPAERRGQANKPHRRLSPLDFGAARAAFALPGVGTTILVNFLIVVAFTNLDQTFRFFNRDAFRMDEAQTGYLFGFIGIVAALVQGGLIRRLVKRYHESRLIRVGALLQVFAFAGLALAPGVGKVLLYAASGLLALGNGMTQPTVSALVSKAADPTAQGATLGTNQAAAALARVIGPACGGFLYGYGMRLPYVAGAVGMGAAFVCALMLRDPTAAPATDARA